MKKILFLVLFSLCSLLFVPCSNAQGNLQFNQVVSLSQSFIGTAGGSNTFNYTGSPITVPSGKVWKVEKISVNGGNNGSGVRINNLHSLSVSDANTGPIWLKASDELKIYTSCYSCVSLSGSYFISIVEFNIIP
jgi:hypothetical protein